MPPFLDVLELIGSVPLGAVEVNAGGRIAAMNRLAAEILENGEVLRNRDGYLEFAERYDSQSIERMIQTAVAHSGRRVTVTLRRPSTGTMVSIAVNGPSDRAQATIFVSDPTLIPPPPDGSLRLLYGFSGYEARLARVLIAGKTLAEAAVELGITTETARTYLKAIFRKVGVKRQCELLVHLLTSPAYTLK